jgi:lysophospholipase L1-like esterase
MLDRRFSFPACRWLRLLARLLPVPILVACLAAGIVLRSASVGQGRPDTGSSAAPAKEPWTDGRLLRGPWQAGEILGESVLFLEQKPGERPLARLLLDAERVTVVRDADGKRTYEAGKDFLLSADGSTLILPAGSRIPFRKQADLFPPRGSPNSIGHRTGMPGTNLLFGEGHFFHDIQVEVSYAPRKEAKWTGYRPSFAGKVLPRTIDRLRRKQPLTVSVSGDSISQGYNASGYTKAAPFQPPYPELVARQLERSWGGKVILKNRAVAGWSVGQGLKDLDNLLADKPDLVVVAYGMNDVVGRNPEGFKTGISTLLKRIREANPATEVVLVASMVGNPEWSATPQEMFPRYRDALASLAGPGVALADLTAVWQKVLERKRFVDVTGNGVNHPNDFGHRLYAQVLLALLVDPELVPGKGRDS